MPASTTSPNRANWIALAVFLVVLVSHAGLMTVRWNSSGLMGQEFRQTQTAISCLFTQQDGYKIDYPTPVLGKPWSAPMEFPLYQWSVAAWANATGEPIHLAGRWVSLLCFYAALPAFFLLLRRLRLPAYQVWLVLAFILASPMYIFYTRAVLIESMAICLVAWHLYFVIRCVDGTGRTPLALLGAWIFGVPAVLIKITTWLGWILPAVILTLALLWRAWKESGKSWRPLVPIATRALLATLPAFLSGLWWTHYADAIKAQNPGAVFLLSKNLTQWNFGTLPMRLSFDFWKSVWVNVTTNQLSTSVVLAAIPFLFLQKGTGRLLLFTFGTFLGTLMIFTNLYFLHDYYYYAISTFVIASGAIIVVRLLEVPQIPRPAAWIAVLVAIALQFTTYYQGYYQSQRIDFYGGSGLTQAIQAVTGKDDVIVIYGDDWASMIPYYSARRALMIPGWREHNEESIHKSIELLKGEKVTLLLMRGNSRGLLDAIDARRRDLNINPQLVFSHIPSGVDVYVVNSEIARVADQIAHGTYHGVQLRYKLPGHDRVFQANKLTPVTDEIARTYFPMMTPAPKLYAIPYDLTVYYSSTGLPRFSAHAPTELIFNIPAKATTAEAVFGVLDGAYTEGRTKGIVFEAFLRKPNTPDQIAYQTFLEPLFTPSDRGPKHFQISIPAEYAGAELVLRSRAGPTGDASYGWGYFEKVSIR